VFFSNRLSLNEITEIKEVYDRNREADGWLYLDFIIETSNTNLL
jgi:hypothetical protein